MSIFCQTKKKLKKFLYGLFISIINYFCINKMSLSSYTQNTRVQVWTGRAWENGYVHENAHGIVRVAPLNSGNFPIGRTPWVDVNSTGFIRLLPPTAPPATATFPVNSWVEVLWQGTWYGAWIHSQQSDGTYTVQWNMPNEQLGTKFKANEIRLNNNPQPASRPQIGGQRVTQTTTTTYPGVVYNTGVVGIVNGVPTRVGYDAYTGLPVFY